jgi:hypothetical protein
MMTFPFSPVRSDRVTPHATHGGCVAAVQQGDPTEFRDSAKDDPDLDPIRGEPAFEQLISG